MMRAFIVNHLLMDGDYFISSPLIYNNIDNIYHNNLYTSEFMCPTIFLKQQLNKIFNLHKQRPSEEGRN
ncbi:hypothetical protein PRUPE_8G214300 [Prunus persica]|uniref:Uncharacterized protein n=1 Tax=Prunus persica TaxID=3760 RepID=A0A251N3F7_PRUPE|nr:hypothetical protein PRUPE_8G214300 [Prunus persica]